MKLQEPPDEAGEHVPGSSEDTDPVSVIFSGFLYPKSMRQEFLLQLNRGYAGTNSHLFDEI